MAVLLTTFALTVVVDLSVAVQFGVVLAALLFVKRMADVTRVGGAGAVVAGDEPPAGARPDHDAHAITSHRVPPGVQVYEINGPVFFGAADKLRNLMPIFTRPPRVMILRLRHVPAIDATGLHALAEFHKQCLARGTHLLLSGVQPQVLPKLHRWPESKAIGRENVVAGIDEALARARTLLGLSPEEAVPEADGPGREKHVA
jgi:SulP family sulfate permease